MLLFSYYMCITVFVVIFLNSYVPYKLSSVFIHPDFRDWGALSETFSQVLVVDPVMQHLNADLHWQLSLSNWYLALSEPNQEN
jgi:hypothetical protein